MRYAEDYHASVLLIGPQRKIVLIKEEQRLPPLLWKFPGGKKEFGENPFQTAIREVKEETGLIITIHNLLLVCELQFNRHTKYCFIGAVPSFEGLVPLSQEFERTGIFEIYQINKMVDIHPTYYNFYQAIKRAGYL